MTKSDSSSPRTTIGLFGGTFDPIHLGHLSIAQALKQSLSLDEMRLVPCHIPPHRRATVATAEQREQMLRLALEQFPQMCIDEVELQNPEPSYSVHTLTELRRQLGEEVSLCLAMGMDSLVTLSSWYRWQDILTLAHIVVAARPGWDLPVEGEVAAYLAEHRGLPEQLKKLSHGKIVVQELALLPISSTEIREKLANNESVQDCVPDSVCQYIHQQQLYKMNAVAQ